MNTIRTLGPALAAGAFALALSAAAAAEIAGWKYEVDVVDLPAPPKLTAPQARPGTPRMAKEMDRTSVPLAQPGSNASAPPLAKKKSLKLK